MCSVEYARFAGRDRLPGAILWQLNHEWELRDWAIREEGLDSLPATKL